MSPSTNNSRLRRIEHRFHAEIVTDITIQNLKRKDTYFTAARYTYAKNYHINAKYMTKYIIGKYHTYAKMK
jgi:hypothetical protein